MKLRELSLTLLAPNDWAHRVGDVEPVAHARRPQPRDVDRLQGLRSGAQLERHVELQHRRFPDAAAGSVLHGRAVVRSTW